MGNLAQARSKDLSRARSEKTADRVDTLSQIRAEGYEDFSYNFAIKNPYQGKESQAYWEGWSQAHLEMTGSKP